MISVSSRVRHIVSNRLPLTLLLPLVLASSCETYPPEARADGPSAQSPEPALQFSGTNLGASQGEDSFSNGTYRLSANGTGFDVTRGESGRFVSTAVPAGNFKIVAHLVSVSGGKNAVFGLMARETLQSLSGMAAVTFEPDRSGLNDSPHFYKVHSRDTAPSSLKPDFETTYFATQGAPLWLKMVRIGDHFAVYRSSDGDDWSAIAFPSGGPFTVKGASRVGVFVAQGEGGGQATAAFDHVSLTTTNLMPYKSSWLGNTFGNGDDHVSGITSALHVSPDGTCYTNAGFEEAARSTHMYKEGKIVPGLNYPLRNSGIAEGSVVGDGERIYLWTQYSDHANGLISTNLAGTDFKALPIVTPIVDEHGSIQLGGMGAGNGEIYLSDALTNQVLVAKAAVPDHGVSAGQPTLVTRKPVDTAGVEGAAPAEVYQSAHRGYLDYPFTGLAPNTRYTVKLHFAEIMASNDAPGKHQFDINMGWPVMRTPAGIAQFDIVSGAGAPFKAVVKTFKDIPSTGDGQLHLSLTPHGNTAPDSDAQINGIEIIKPDGTPFVQLNCGGPDILGTNWVGEAAEMPARAFAFTRPGPIAVDKRGNLWIVQSAMPYPNGSRVVTTPGLAAIKCYDRFGRFQGRQITDVINPLAVAYDAKLDRLLVAENGPDQNIRIYTGLDETPRCGSTFGAQGGIFAGKTPGVMYDADSGGWARFFTPTGVGVDEAGNLYVASSHFGLHTDLRAFKPDGSLLWKLQGLEFCNVGDFDADVPSSDVWTSFRHYKMNWASTVPGGEWSLYSYGWDPFKRGEGPPNEYNSSAIYRKLGPAKQPFTFAAGQGFLGDILIRRRDGEQMIPCGVITSQGKVWLDANGDEKRQDNEVRTMTGPDVEKMDTNFFDVADNGDIYLGGNGGKGPYVVRRLRFLGLDSHGTPRYDGIDENVELRPSPPGFVPSGGRRPRIRYIGATDTMYFMGIIQESVSPGVHITQLTRVDNWSTQPKVVFNVNLPTPLDNLNFQYPPAHFPAGDGFIYMAFDVANDYVFCVELPGAIHVIDARTGKQVTKILPGPELSGMAAWEDEGMGLRAHYNKANGAYYILAENSGLESKQNLYRWKP